jgi:hypothetical protein
MRITMENTILKVIGLFVMSIFIMSCEGYRCGDGKVYDADTLEPLDSVFCEVLTGSETQYTDSTGHLMFAITLEVVYLIARILK